jgi:hypothetical protein
MIGVVTFNSCSRHMIHECSLELNLRIGCTEVICIFIGNEMIPWLVSESFVCAQRRSIHNRTTINTITFIHRMLKIASFELIYRRSRAYVCDIQSVQASIRHVSSSDENYKWRKWIKSSTPYESHYLHSINPTISCVWYSTTSHCWFRFSSSKITLRC